MIVLSDDLKQKGVKLRQILGSDVEPIKSEALVSLQQKLIQDILKNWDDEKIKQDPILKEYHRLHTEYLGDKAEQYVAAPEALLLFILKNQKIPSINDIVDCYNIVSVQYRIAIGSHDLARVTGAVKIEQINGSERFIPLGMDKEVQPPDRAYAFKDDTDILCLLETRQCDKTKITPKTNSCITYIQGNNETPDEYMDQAANELLALFQNCCKGEFNEIVL